MIKEYSPKVTSKLTVVALFAVLALISMPVAAYVGPGTGLSAIGSLVALLAAVLIAVLGFLWYPLKRVLRRRRAKQQDEAPLETEPLQGEKQLSSQRNSEK